VAQCSAIAGSGQRCKGVVVRGSDLCAAHDPRYQERRRSGAKRGGRKRPGASAELATLKAELATLYSAAAAGRVETSRAAVCAQIQNVRLRLLDQQRRWFEADELEARIEALEAEQDPGTGASWGG
jgi:hypothetical protein